MKAVFLQINLFSRLSFFPFWLSIGIPHRRHLDTHFYHSAIIHRQTFLQIKIDFLNKFNTNHF